MTIKHIVIGGAGIAGFKFLGILQHLNEQDFWKIENIESIHATSVGTIIGVFLMLKYDWETLNKYIIQRPWKDVFLISGENILNTFYKKGIFDQKFFEIIFKPLLEARDLSLEITLKEFYEYTKIDFYLYTFELNNYLTEELNYKTHPDLPLLKAISMSSALPYVFSPICFDKKCYVDGAIMAQYPLNYCLKRVTNIEEILAINVDMTNNDTTTTIIDDSSTIIDYFSEMIVKTIHFILETNIHVNQVIPFEIKCETGPSMYSLDVIHQIILKSELRKQNIEEGYEISKMFLEKNNK